MHGASCVERERTAGPEGSAEGGGAWGVGEECPDSHSAAWSPGTSTGGDGGKRLVWPCPHSSVPAFVLKITIRSCLPGSRFSISQCIFIESQLQPDGPALAEWIKWRRVTVSSSLRAHLTFSSAAIFLPVGPSRSLTGYLKSRARRAS